MSSSTISDPNRHCFSQSITFTSLQELRKIDTLALMRSNHFSRNDITQLIQKSKPELAAYGREIAKLSSALIAMENAQTELKSYQERLTSLLAPIRKLPAELLSKIFEHCAATSKFGLRRVSIPARVYSQVCSFWRSVARSTLSLWANITFDIRSSIPDDILTTEVASVLELSGQVPLTLTIEDSGCDVREIGPLHPALKAILDQSQRVSSVHLQLPYLESTMELWDLAGLKWDCLQQLDVLLRGPGNRGQYSPIAIFDHAPHLKALVLRRAFKSEVALPWSQIVKFEHHFVTPYGFLGTLACCSNAESARVTGSYTPTEEPSGLATFNHPNLKSLLFEIIDGNSDISNVYLGALKAFAAHCTAPALESLTFLCHRVTSMLRLVDFDPERLRVDLTKFPIRTLTLTNVFPSKTTDFITLLRGVPLLRDLRLTDSRPESRLLHKTDPLGDELLDALFGVTRISQGMRIVNINPLVPQLENLTLESPGYHFTVNKFVDLVRSRWMPFNDESESEPTGGQGRVAVRSLRSISLNLKKEINVPELRQLGYMAVGGLSVLVVDRRGVVFKS
jgi:hypothetical protein